MPLVSPSLCPSPLHTRLQHYIERPQALGPDRPCTQTPHPIASQKPAHSCMATAVKGHGLVICLQRKHLYHTSRPHLQASVAAHRPSSAATAEPRPPGCIRITILKIPLNISTSFIKSPQILLEPNIKATSPLLQNHRF